MPSTQDLPTINDFLDAGRKALRGEFDQFGDTHVGAIYDHTSGPVAILLSREVERDQNLFEDGYWNAARDDALTTLIEGRYGIARILATQGQGMCLMSRTSASAGSGTLWAGTRIQVGGTPPKVYEIATDTPVSATQKSAQVPIKALAPGSGSAVYAPGGLSLLDPLYDSLWLPQTLSCADGTDYEPANAYRARALAERLNSRNGYLPEIVQTCRDQGATYVVAFASQYGLTNDDAGFADDFGLNAIYVSDSNFQSTPTLIQACAVALDSVRVLGADLWVGGIAQSQLYVQAVVNLVSDPGKLDKVPILRQCVQALLAYFAPTDAGYTFKRSALAGALVHAHPSVQKVSAWVSPTSDATLAPNAWPATLTRYTLLPRYVNLQLVGPS